MTKELYNELRSKGLITKPHMTFDYINKHKVELKDIITVPAQLEKYLNNTEIVVEPVEEVKETVIEPVVEVKEETVEEVKETVVETVEEVKEEIVVDEPEVEEKPKTKKN